MRCKLWPWLVSLVIMCGFTSTGFTASGKPRITILAKEYNGYTASIAKSIELSAISDHYFVSTTRIEDWKHHERTTLYVALGIDAVQFLASKELDSPVLSGLITSSQWHEFLQKNSDSPFNAIFYDPDLVKQLILAKQLFPQEGSVGLMHSSSFKIHKPILEVVSKHLNLPINFKLNDKAANFYKEYAELSSNNGIVFIVPDRVNFNRNTIPKAILTSYRQNTYVVGYSKGLVKSGVFATCFTNSSNYNDDILESLNALLKNSDLKFTRHSRYFSIAINDQVAKSLGVTLPEIQELKSTIERITDEIIALYRETNKNKSDSL